MVQELAVRLAEHDVYACGGREYVLQILSYKKEDVVLCTQAIVMMRET